MVVFDSVGRADRDAQNFVSIGPSVPKLFKFEVVLFDNLPKVKNAKFALERVIDSKLDISEFHRLAEHDAANREQIDPAIREISAVCLLA